MSAGAAPASDTTQAGASATTTAPTTEGSTALFNPTAHPFVSPNQRDYDDYEFLLATAQAGKAKGLSNFAHLDQPIGIWNYIRIANEIAERIPSGRLLDWGCGFGQMTYLLGRRGFDVTAFDVGPEDAALPDVPLCREIHAVRPTHPTRLPFPTDSFDAGLGRGGP